MSRPATTLPEHSIDWQPSAGRDIAALRARQLDTIRRFFAEREVLEVETPILSQVAVTDLHIDSFQQGERYLQTSPESSMKRLIAADYGDIFQVCKVFRRSETGRYHTAEFTMLEWYRIGFDHHGLMSELEDLLKRLFGCGRALEPCYRISYRDALSEYAELVDDDIDSLEICLRTNGIDIPAGLAAERRYDDLLDLLLSQVVASRLPRDRIVSIYDYPVSQAAMAKIRPGRPPVAERFETYFQGIELANGFFELTDVVEQRCRFESDLKQRERLGMETVPTDEALLAALECGLPDCAGVAVGLDRVLMLIAGAKRIDDVLSFPFARA